MSDSSAQFSISGTPRAFIKIYTYEGGQYMFSDQDNVLVSVMTTGTVRSIGSGFSIVLAPGGPLGFSSRPSWAEIITPGSLAVIGMVRGSFSRITMIGIVRTSSEESIREHNAAERIIRIQGDGFSKFFNSFNYYNLATTTGFNALNETAFLSAVSESLLFGSPDSLGKAWLTQGMGGSKGILSKTQIPYQNTALLFGDVMSAVFEPYPANVTIPMSVDFIGNGSFASKFQTFFPYPWYELYLTTAPVDTYKSMTGYQAAKSPISLDGFLDSSPTLVARVNPLPAARASTSQYTATFDLDYARWLALPANKLYGHGERAFSTVYDESEVRNMYIINPLLLSKQFGTTNGSNNPFMYTFAGWIDNASIHRYGYRPQITETHWFSDANGIAAQQSAAGGVTMDTFTQLVSDLALKVTSYHEPTPLMARANLESTLRPDIIEGTKFTHVPYRDGIEWTFYIESVTNSYTHGGKCTTQLSLTRGLPTSVYEDKDLLLAVHMGNAQRKNGVVVKGLPSNVGSPLAALNFGSAQQLLADNSAMFATPQANTPASNPITPAH